MVYNSVYSKKSEVFIVELTLAGLDRMDKTIEMLERYQSGKQNSGDTLTDVISVFEAIRDMRNLKEKALRID